MLQLLDVKLLLLDAATVVQAATGVGPDVTVLHDVLTKLLLADAAIGEHDATGVGPVVAV